MAPARQTSSIEGVVLTSQTIAAALIAGVIVFAVISFLQAHDPPDNDSFLPIMATVFAGFACLGSLVVPGVVTGLHESQIEQAGMSPDEKVASLIPNFQVRVIVAMALLEGAAFFVLVAQMTTGQKWLMGVAAVLVLFMAAHFPSRSRMASFIEREKQRMEID